MHSAKNTIEGAKDEFTEHLRRLAEKHDVSFPAPDGPDGNHVKAALPTAGHNILQGEYSTTTTANQQRPPQEVAERNFRDDQEQNKPHRSGKGKKGKSAGAKIRADPMVQVGRRHAKSKAMQKKKAISKGRKTNSREVTEKQRQLRQLASELGIEVPL